MNKEQVIGELTVKATMLQGIPMVSLEDCTRAIQKMGKTEQEVREAITITDSMTIEGAGWSSLEKLEETREKLQDIAVIIGKALGVIATCDNCKNRDKDMPFCNSGYGYSKNGSCKGYEVEE